MSNPTRLGKYEVRRELGKGSMGVVYEAFDPFIERRVAIKVIRQDQLGPEQTRDLLARLRREAQAAGRLNHPGIVAIYDYGEDSTLGGSGIAYIAMELIDGRELKDYFDADHTFPPQEVVRIMDEVLAALQHAHERGVTHRDVKPSNVILLRDGRVKVADFGVARLDTSELTQAGTMIGTPMYMSPEQILGLTIDGRADLFSCGVMLYQFLTGEKPFTGSITTVMQKVLHVEPVPVTQLNTALSPAWDGVLRLALAKKPEARYASAAAMAEGIRRASLEPSPGQRDEKTVVLPRRAASVSLPSLGAAAAPGASAAARPAQSAVNKPGSSAAAATPAPAAGTAGTATPTPAPRPPAAPPGPAGSSRVGLPTSGAQSTNAALATVVANALAGSSAISKPVPPPPAAATLPRSNIGPKALAAAAVIGGASLVAYWVWPSKAPVKERPEQGVRPAASAARTAASPSLAAALPAPAPVPAVAPSAILPSIPAPDPVTAARAPETKPLIAAAPAAALPATAPSKPGPAPKASSPSPPAPVATAPATAPAPAPAATDDWRPRLAKLESLRGQVTLAQGLAALLEPFSAEERALATEFEAQFKQRPGASALVVGVIDGQFRANWQTGARSAERAAAQARKRCEELRAAGCSALVVNGEFQRDALLTVARELGSQPPAAVRQRVMRSFERTLGEWRQTSVAETAPSPASPSYPSAPPAAAPAPAPAPAPASRSTEAPDPARAEWAQTLALMRSENPGSLSRGLELLLHATSAEDVRQLSQFQSAVKRMRWNSAVAMGEKNGLLVFAYFHSERRPDWAQERAISDCTRVAGATCALVMADGSFVGAGLTSLAARLGSRNQTAVRENFMRYVQRKLTEGFL